MTHEKIEIGVGPATYGAIQIGNRQYYCLKNLPTKRSISLQAVLCQFQRVRFVCRFQVVPEPFATRLLCRIRAGGGD
jgi:hypothetical protein